MATAIFRPGDKPLLNLGLLGATVVTTTVGYLLFYAGLDLEHLTRVAVTGALPDSIKFSVSLLLILGSHEMGHYLLARRHGVDTSLPYFIPTPPPLGIGTLGAVIRIRGPIPNANALVDIGAAGPLAGLAVAIPIMMLGLREAPLAQALTLPADTFPRSGSLLVGLPHFVQWIVDLIRGTPGVETNGITWFHDPLLVKLLLPLVREPIPAGQELSTSPFYLAAWFGLLVTMLNLLPVGQLDGGHLSHALLGRRAETVGKLFAGVLVALTLFWSFSWIVWLLVVTKFVGFRHPPVIDPGIPLTPGRKLICALCLIALVLCFMPAPITQVTLP